MQLLLYDDVNAKLYIGCIKKMLKLLKIVNLISKILSILLDVHDIVENHGIFLILDIFFEFFLNF